MKLFQIVFLIPIILTAGCKTDRNSSNANPVSEVAKNETSLFNNTGLVDLSDKVSAKPIQEWPEVPSYIHFRSRNIVNVYFQESANNVLDFNQNDLIGIVGRKIDYGVNFKVDNIDLSVNPIKINLKTVRNNLTKSSNRPCFVFGVPKKYSASTPVITLDSILMGGMIID